MIPVQDGDSHPSGSQRAATALMVVGALTILVVPGLVAGLLGADNFVTGIAFIAGFLVMVALLVSVPSGTKIP